MPNLQPALPKNDGPQAFKEKLLMRVFLHGTHTARCPASFVGPLPDPTFTAHGW